VVVDGVREAARDAVPDAPPLLPPRDGLGPRPERARVARDGSRLTVLVPRPATGGLLLLDPDGTTTAWWRVELGAEAPTARRCEAVRIAYERPFPMPPRTSPCEADPRVVVAVGEDWVEVGFPPGLTTSGRLLWGEKGPRGGSWAVDGGLDPAPEKGRPLDLGLRTGGLPVEADPVGRVLHARLVPGADTPRGDWRWSIRFVGRLLGTGAVALPAGAAEARFDVPWTPRQHAWLELRGPEVDGVAVTLTQRLWWAEPVIWPTSPVVADAVELRWSSPVPLKAVPLELEDGRHAWRGTVALPAGSGRLRITLPKGWGAPTVAAPPLMPATALVR
jgi:hypothetical protein